MMMKARVKSRPEYTKDVSHLACHDFPKDPTLPFDSPGTVSMLESPEGSLESEKEVPTVKGRRVLGPFLNIYFPSYL